MLRQPGPTLRLALGGLLAALALNAFGGGLYGMAGAEGVPPEWLASSPFRSYVVPGLILFVVVGGSAAVAAVQVLRRAPRARRSATAAGLVLLVWIAAQVATIGYVSFLQPVMAVVAASILGMAWRLPDARPSAGED